MICTVTFNPSVDYVIDVEHFQTGRINRTSSEHIFAGGKGINVSLILKELDTPTSVIAFTAGHTGRMIAQMLEEKGLETRLIELAEGESRINVKMSSDEETEINGRGPVIREEDMERLYQLLAELTEEDMLVLSGSVPASLDRHVYAEITEYLEQRHVRTAVDAEGQLLTDTLAYHPFVIKPNDLELSQIFGVPVHTEEDVITCARKLQEMGARNVIVSRGSRGSVLADEAGGIHVLGIHSGTVRSTVGAGDSMLAGFLAGYEKTKDYETALRWGSAAGSATAFSYGLAERAQIEALIGGNVWNR